MTDLGPSTSKSINKHEDQKKIRILLEELFALQNIKPIGICGYCGRKNAESSCKKCIYLHKKFVAEKWRRSDCCKENTRNWQDKDRYISNEVKKKRPPISSNEEYEKILQNLAKPLMRTDTKKYPVSLADVIPPTNVLNEVVNKITDTAGKYKEIKDGEKRIEPQIAVKENNIKQLNENLKSKIRDGEQPQTEIIASEKLEAPVSFKNRKKRKENLTNNEKHIKTASKQVAEKRDTENKSKISTKNIIRPFKPLIEYPHLKYKKNTTNSKTELGNVEKSDSILVCQSDLDDREIIYGNKILKWNPQDERNEIDVQQLFKKYFACPFDISLRSQDKKVTTTTHKNTKKNEKYDKVDKIDSRKDMKKYALSDGRFLVSGWTHLPVPATYREVNIFKMKPVSVLQWFSNKEKGKYFYGSGAIFAQIDADGNGKWYYLNGLLALNYFSNPDLFENQHYCVHSSGEEGDEPGTLLASFDYGGEGIVYDCSSKIRLKYNQNEGLVSDDTISPPARWKWHDLNDPPVVKTVYLERAPDDTMFIPTNYKPPNQHMLSLEKKQKQLQNQREIHRKFKLFQVKKKLKINKYFSMHIEDQKSVYLSFRCHTKNIKLGVGMELTTKVVGSTLVKMDDVTTRYDSLQAVHRPPRFV